MAERFESFEREKNIEKEPSGDSRRVPHVEREWDTTLAALKRVLESKLSKSRLPKDLFQRIEQAVKSADAEIVERGTLSETTARNLDSLYAESRQ